MNTSSRIRTAAEASPFSNVAVAADAKEKGALTRRFAAWSSQRQSLLDRDKGLGVVAAPGRRAGEIGQDLGAEIVAAQAVGDPQRFYEFRASLIESPEIPKYYSSVIVQTEADTWISGEGFGCLTVILQGRSIIMRLLIYSPDQLECDRLGPSLLSQLEHPIGVLIVHQSVLDASKCAIGLPSPLSASRPGGGCSAPGAQRIVRLDQESRALGRRGGDRNKASPSSHAAVRPCELEGPDMEAAMRACASASSGAVIIVAFARAISSEKRSADTSPHTRDHCLVSYSWPLRQPW